MATRTPAKSKKAPLPVDPRSALPDRPIEVIPDLDRSVDVLGAHVVADAIEAYMRAEHRYQVVFRRTGGSADANVWDLLAQELRNDAARAVMAAILCWYYPGSDRGPYDKMLFKKWPALGVSYRGMIFAMTPDPDVAFEPTGAESIFGAEVMRLAVLEPLQGQAIRPDLSELTDLDEFFNRPKAPEPTPKARPDADAETAAFLARDGYGVAFDANEAAAARARDRNLPAYSITTQDILIYHEPNRLPLDEVIANQVAYIEKYGEDDMAIWQGPKLLAVVKTDDDGKGVATRFDDEEPASLFDLGSLGGEHQPEDPIFNAPPEPKPRRKAKGEAKPKAKRTPRTVRS